MAPLMSLLVRDHRFDIRLCITGQHRQMLDQALDLFRLEADYDLNVMRGGQEPADVTAAILMQLKSVLVEFRPDIVLVHGDTATTFAATLSAYYQKIPVGHVEAGLRTGNLYAPWPEEANRKLTGALASLHFAPTESAKKNLLLEGVDPASIHVTGNTVIDALLDIAEKVERDKALQEDFHRRFPYAGDGKRILLVTGHRRESLGGGFERVCSALLETVARFPDVEIVYPVHLNPQVQEPVRRLLGTSERVHLIEPMGYLPFIQLMHRSHLIITDSGGIQEEAPSLGKPVLVTRDVTERPEAVEAGTVRLVGTDADRIVAEVTELLRDSAAYERMSFAHNPYGDGKASERVLAVLASFRREQLNEV